MTDNYHLNALPPGSWLQEYQVERVLGEGSFGIVYLARDKYLHDQVAIKEYLPRELATRIDGATVAPTSTASEKNFVWGRQKFLEEARLLKQLATPQPHPNIVTVRRFFEQHGTAYLVMDFEQGAALAEVIRLQGRLPPAQLSALMTALLDGLAAIHAAGITHRDIKPDNILIRADGTPVFLDFGAARLALGERTQSAFNAMSPAYAALEQHLGEDRIGAWTDIYGLGATLYRAVTGNLPQTPIERMAEARHRPAAEVAEGDYDPRLLAAIDAALTLRPEERPQDVAALRRILAGGPEATVLLGRPTAPPSPAEAPTQPVPRSRRGGLWLGGLAAGLALLAVALGAPYLMPTSDLATSVTAPEVQPVAPPDPDLLAREEAARAAQAAAEEAARRRAALEAELAAQQAAQEEAERQETERQAALAAEEEARREAERQEAERQAALAAEAEARREAERQEAERQAALAAEAEARRLAEETARREAAEEAERQAAAAAQREAEEAARRQAELAAQREAEQAARREAELAAQRAAKAEAERLAAEAAEREAEEAARREAERLAKAEATAKAAPAAEARESPPRQQAVRPPEPDFLVAPRDETQRAKSAANVRAGPSTDAAQLATLAPGQTVQVTGGVVGRDWLAVALADGTKGYVWAPLLAKPSAAPAPGETAIAKAAPPPEATPDGKPVMTTPQLSQYLDEQRDELMRKLTLYNQTHRVMVPPSGDIGRVKRLYNPEIQDIQGDRALVAFNAEVDTTLNIGGPWYGREVFELRLQDGALDFVDHRVATLAPASRPTSEETPVRSRQQVEDFLKANRWNLMAQLTDYNRDHQMLVAANGKTKIENIVRQEVSRLSGDRVWVESRLSVGTNYLITAGDFLIEYRWAGDQLAIVGHQKL